MKAIEALVLLGAIAPTALAAELARPRGVSPDFAKYYKSKETFTCITAPSIILDISKVNDDYCDCPDGSDEPGTSACSFLSPRSPPQPVPGSVTGTSNTTNALPGFYCKNKGHVPAYIPFMYVNDGVCDYELCCDGSDEWEGVGGVKCEDRCAAMGKEYKKKQAEKEKAAQAAGRKRAELVKDAEKKKGDLRDRVAGLEREVQELEEKAADAKRKYEDIERRERGRVVMGGSDKATKTTVLARLAKARVEELRDALLQTIDKRDRARDQVKKLEGILSTFKEEYNPNFNDEGVKRAVKAWEDYAAAKHNEMLEVPAAERDIAELAKPDSEAEGINWAEFEAEDEESDVDALYRIEAYLPEPVRHWIHSKLRDARVFLIDNGILADNPSAAGESKIVQAAREAMHNAENTVNNKKRERDDLQIELDKDFGPDDVFRALKSTCVSSDSGEYTYELCWMDRTTQISKKGGGHTGLGTFTRFERQHFDEEVGPDGKGVGTGERLVLRYENGQHCWNGPNRETTVVVACAERDEIWKVAEMEKCVYRMDVGSPAGCEPRRGAGENEKDEL